MIRTSAAALVCAALATTSCGAQAAPVSAGSTADVAPVVLAGSTTAAAGGAARAATTSVAVRTSTAAPAGRFAIGDSVMLGSKRLLRAKGFRVDAKVSRQFGSAVSLVRARAASGSLPRNVVVHLGTNGTITLKACRAVVRAAGSSRRVFLVNVRVPRPWQASNNRTLARCDASFAADRVQIVDWYRYSAGHRNWFGGDRVHPSTRGRTYYTALIARTVSARGL